MNAKPWKKIGQKVTFGGYRNLHQKTFELPDGRTVDYDCVGGGQIVCVLALTTDNRVILAKQFRPGPEKYLLELPGGALEKNESPEEAMQRELLEETGYSGKLQLVVTTPVDGYSSSVRHHLVATDCIKVAEPVADKDNEPAELILMDLDEFRAHIRSGQFTDIATGYLGLEFLGML